jgi:hypothetical protein
MRPNTAGRSEAGEIAKRETRPRIVSRKSLGVRRAEIRDQRSDVSKNKPEEAKARANFDVSGIPETSK